MLNKLQKAIVFCCLVTLLTACSGGVQTRIVTALWYQTLKD
jgi:hypothetical protein